MSWKEQFGRPRGVLGWIAGKLMGRGKGEFALDLLGDVGVAPTDRVLEIGFGPGIGIEVAARLASQGRVFGVDISDVMLRMAARRNRGRRRADDAGAGEEVGGVVPPRVRAVTEPSARCRSRRLHTCR